MLTRRILVDIQTVAPMTISAMHKGTFFPDRNKIARTKVSGGSECSLTVTMPIPGVYGNKEKTAGAAEVAVDEDARGGVQYLPIIPASTITGGMRRVACGLIEQSVLDRRLKISVAAFNMLSSGSATATLVPATKVTTFDAADKHPFIGLFGGTSFSVASTMVVADGVPVCEETRGMSLLTSSEPEMLLRPYQMLTPVQIIRKNDAVARDSSRLIEIVGFEEISEYWASQSEQAVKRKESKVAAAAAQAAGEAVEKGKKETLQTATAIEAVMPNVSFSLSFEVRAASEVHLGLALLSLQGLLRKGQFGGRAARGFGRYLVRSACIAEKDREGVWQRSSLFNDLAKLDFDERLNPFVEAADDWVDNCSIPEIEAFAAADEKFFMPSKAA